MISVSISICLLQGSDICMPILDVMPGIKIIAQLGTRRKFKRCGENSRNVGSCGSPKLSVSQSCVAYLPSILVPVVGLEFFGMRNLKRTSISSGLFRSGDFRNGILLMKNIRRKNFV